MQLEVAGDRLSTALVALLAAVRDHRVPKLKPTPWAELASGQPDVERQLLETLAKNGLILLHGRTGPRLTAAGQRVVDRLAPAAQQNTPD